MEKAKIFKITDAYIEHLQDELKFLRVLKSLGYQTIDEAIKAQETITEKAKCNILV